MNAHQTNFWDFWNDNRQKVLGSITAFFSVLGGLLASGAFDMLLSHATIGWLGIITALVTGVSGSATVHSGISNTTKERVAAAEARTATAMAIALNTPPPPGGLQ